MAKVARVRMRVPAAPVRQSLCETLDTLLDTGIVAAGEIRIQVAGIDLLYVALELVACSWDRATRMREGGAAARCGARAAAGGAA